MYKAKIYFTEYEDTYDDGQGEQVGNWDDELTAETAEELKQKITEATRSEWADIDGEQYNEYEHAFEYSANYQADEDGEEPTEEQLKLWMSDDEDERIELFSVDCQILVTKEVKVDLDEEIS